MTVIEELQTAVNTIDMLIEIEQSDVYEARPHVTRLARKARNRILRALDDLEGIPATVCVDNGAVQRMIDAAGVEYRRSVFM